MDEQSEYYGPSWIDFVINKIIGPLFIYVGFPLGLLLAGTIALLALGLAVAAIPVVLGLAIVAAIIRTMEEPEWYNSGSKLALMLLLFFPIGIYGFVKTQSVSPQTKKLAGKIGWWIVVISFSLRVLLWLTGHSQTFWQY